MYLRGQANQGNRKPESGANTTAAELAGKKSAFSFEEYINQYHVTIEGSRTSAGTKAKMLYLRCGHRCSQVALHPYFSNFITAIIILASTLVGIQTYPAMEYVPGREFNSKSSRVWALMDQIVLYIFTLEVVVKVMAEGLAPWRYFGRYEVSVDEHEDIALEETHIEAEPRDSTMSSNRPMQDLGEIWIMASKQSIAMTQEQRVEFKSSGIRDPEKFMKTIAKGDAVDPQEGFSMTKVKLDFWNIFDFVVVVVCYLPLGASMVAVIRLFRLLRVLKLVKALPELQVLVMGLLSSMTAIFYVGLMLLLVFYLYAVLCVSMLRENDPVHWGDLQIAYVTLFRMATLEDWIDIVYTAMLGCNVYGYGFREDECPAPDVAPKPMGWIAAPLFVSFVFVATFVVLNLFIGVINENMGIAKEQLEDMKRMEELKKAEQEFKEDSDSQELVTELHLLTKRMKLLRKRSARLHQAFGMVQYDMKTFVEKMRLRSERFEVNMDGAMEERPPKLFRKRSTKVNQQQRKQEELREDGSLEDDNVNSSDPVLPYNGSGTCS